MPHRSTPSQTQPPHPTIMTVTLGSTPFTVREGVFGTLQAPFAAKGVSQMANGRVRLTMTKEGGEWRSAGILGPVMEAGKPYELEILGRLDVLDPRVCFAVWGKDDSGTNEVDFLEATRWGDRNQEHLYTAAFHKDGVAFPSGRLLARAYDRHRVTIVTAETSCMVTVAGYRPPSEPGQWPTTAKFTLPFFEGMRFKIALWVPKTGPLYAAVRDRGPLTVDVRGFRVS